MTNYTISVDLSRFQEFKVVTNRDGEKILLVNLDRTPGIARSASGKYYLNLLAFRMKEHNPYGHTHAVLRSIPNALVAAGIRRDFPVVGTLGPFNPKREERRAAAAGPEVSDQIDSWESGGIIPDETY